MTVSSDQQTESRIVDDCTNFITRYHQLTTDANTLALGTEALCEQLSQIIAHPVADRYSVLVEKLLVKFVNVLARQRVSSSYQQQNFQQCNALTIMEMKKLPREFFKARNRAHPKLLLENHSGFSLLNAKDQQLYIDCLHTKCTPESVVNFIRYVNAHYKCTIAITPSTPVTPVTSDSYSTMISASTGTTATDHTTHDDSKRESDVLRCNDAGEFIPPFLKGVGIVTTFNKDGETHILFKRDPERQYADVFGGKIEIGNSGIIDTDSIATACREMSEETDGTPYLYLTKGLDRIQLTDYDTVDKCKTLLSDSQHLFERLVRSKPLLIHTTPGRGVPYHMTIAFGVYILENLELPIDIFTGKEDSLLYTYGEHYSVFTIPVRKLHTIKLHPRLKSIDFCRKIQALYAN